MRRVMVVVEGPTESTFLSLLLARRLASQRIAIAAPILGRAGHKGGVVVLDRVVPEVVRHLRTDRGCTVTTFFDYYRLNWKSAGSPQHLPATKAVEQLEAQLADRILAEFDSSFDRSRFIPYIQLHEFEALYFAQPDVIADALGQPELTNALERVVRECGGCEAINDRPDTHPAARFSSLFTAYEKGRGDGAQAPIFAARMQLETVRERCPRFDQWLRRLESLQPA